MMFVGIFTLVCLAHFVAADGNSIEQIPIRNEMTCAFQGGICTMKDDCPIDYLTTVKGLCPQQQSMGVECCYGIPLSDKSCRGRGGECMNEVQCHNGPRVAADCNSNEVCCILV